MVFDINALFTHTHTQTKTNANKFLTYIRLSFLNARRFRHRFHEIFHGARGMCMWSRGKNEFRII